MRIQCTVICNHGARHVILICQSNMEGTPCGTVCDVCMCVSSPFVTLKPYSIPLVHLQFHIVLLLYVFLHCSDINNALMYEFDSVFVLTGSAFKMLVFRDYFPNMPTVVPFVKQALCQACKYCKKPTLGKLLQQMR